MGTNFYIAFLFQFDSTVLLRYGQKYFIQFCRKDVTRYRVRYKHGKQTITNGNAKITKGCFCQKGKLNLNGRTVEYTLRYRK